MANAQINVQAVVEDTIRDMITADVGFRNITIDLINQALDPDSKSSEDNFCMEIGVEVQRPGFAPHRLAERFIPEEKCTTEHEAFVYFLKYLITTGTIQMVNEIVAKAKDAPKLHAVHVVRNKIKKLKPNEGNHD